jgi:5-methylcytosine-specific restriction endonuclease McrA
MAAYYNENNRECAAMKNRRRRDRAKERARLAAFRAAHPEKMREYSARYYAKHKERALAARRAWAAANKERKARLDRLWRKANSEKVTLIYARYRAKHREKRKAQAAAWDAANRGRILAYRDATRERKRARARAYSASHPIERRAAWHARRARILNSSGRYTAAEIAKLAIMQRHRCANPACFVPIRERYHIDHIEPLCSGGSNSISNIQLLCPTCNMKKNRKDPVRWARENGLLL